MKYTVIGKDFRTVSEADTEEYYQQQTDDFYGIFPDGNNMIFHVFNRYDNSYVIDSTDNVFDIINTLAIKEGCNMVQYENGNYGFIGYYNGHEDYIEIMPLSMPIK